MFIFPSASLEAIFASPHRVQESNFSTLKPAASALAQVVPIATKLNLWHVMHSCFRLRILPLLLSCHYGQLLPLS